MARVRGICAKPQLIVTTACGFAACSNLQPETASRMRSATTSAAPAFVPSKMTANSSPPIRHATSWFGSVAASMERAISFERLVAFLVAVTVFEALEAIGVEDDERERLLGSHGTVRAWQLIIWQRRCAGPGHKMQ